MKLIDQINIIETITEHLQPGETATFAINQADQFEILRTPPPVAATREQVTTHFGMTPAAILAAVDQADVQSQKTR